MGNFQKKPKKQKDLDSDLVNSAKSMDISDEFSKAMLEAASMSDTASIQDVDAIRRDAVWLTDNLLTFPDFCSSADHMNFPPLSERQRRVAEYMFGSEPKKIFDNNRNTAILVWGKGGGKDTISALMKLYVVYILLNIKNPQRFLSLPDNVNIDLLNVAASKEQAQTVYFQILKTLTLNWPWLRKQYDLVINGRFFSSGQTDAPDTSNKVTITNDAVIFPKNIRAFSGSCEAETLEGKNLLMFVLDEADAFKSGSQIRSAAKIYRTVRTSAVSRFGKKYKGFIISYPRSSGGYMMTMYKQSLRFLNMYGDIAKTWEVKPREMFSKETFEFEGHDIPMEFYEDFRLDPTGSKSAYLCDPPAVESLFLDDPDKIELATTGFVRPLFDFKDSVRGEYVRKEIARSPFKHNKAIQHVLLLDLSLKKDSTALTLMHRQDERIIVDFSTVWVPDEKRKLVVDLQNVEEIINKVRESVTISGLYCDRWNSAMLVQKLRSKGVKADTVKLEYDDFELFKRLLYAGNVQLPKNDRLLNELKSLQQVTQQRVDHPEGGHNDMAVTIVMGVKMLAKTTNADGGLGLLAEGEFVGDNLSGTMDDFEEFVPERGEGIIVDGFPL